MPDTPEQAQEYKEMAALACHLIDIIADIAAVETSLTIQQLREQIAFTKEQKDLLIRNPEERRIRYRTASLLYSLNRTSKPNES